MALGKTSHNSTQSNAEDWEASGYQLPQGVKAATWGPRCLELHVEGRRKKAVDGRPSFLGTGVVHGCFEHHQNDGIVMVPENRNGKRKEDAELLNAVGSLMGIPSWIPGSGRRSKGISWKVPLAVEYLRTEEGCSLSEAARLVAKKAFWSPWSVETEYYRWKRSQVE